MAHDFNNLLTVVLGQAENIMRAAPENERIQRMAGALRRAAEQGAQLTDQLLTFARHQQLHVESVSVRRLVASIRALLRRAAGETIVLEIGAEARLWPSQIDAAQFESALLNLVINARDAMPHGGRIAIRARNATVSLSEAQRLDLESGDYVLVSVADSGCGMPPDVLHRCFDPFFTTKEVGKGTGLGLAQIYGFARQCGGTVTIDSTVNQGTTAYLYLPRAAASSASRDAKGAGAALVGQGRTILVVEDRQDVRETIATSLGGQGYRIVTAPDGVEARRLLEGDQPIDLLLTDIVMPNGVNGIDLARAARRLRRNMKIVLMSGFDRDMHRQVSESEAFAFVRKPFRQAELIAAIVTALGRGNKSG